MPPTPITGISRLHKGHKHILLQQVLSRALIATEFISQDRITAFNIDCHCPHCVYRHDRIRAAILCSKPYAFYIRDIWCEFHPNRHIYCVFTERVISSTRAGSVPISAPIHGRAGSLRSAQMHQHQGPRNFGKVKSASPKILAMTGTPSFAMFISCWKFL